MLAILALVNGLPRLREYEDSQILNACGLQLLPCWDSMDDTSCTSIIGLP